MKSIQSIRVCAVLSFLLFLSVARGDVTVGGLQCEYLTDPLGIDVTAPRFTWKLADSAQTRGQKQTGYHVLVASSPAQLAQDQGDIWDSKDVASSQSALVPFAGHPLRSGEDCYWKVQILDRDGKPSAWSTPAHFSMGLLAPGDWKGSWIQHPAASNDPDIWYRKTFRLPAKPVSAYLYVASVGYHEVYVNGRKIDARVLAPALSRLDKRILYVTYDLAPALQAGKNCVGIWTGPGWAHFAPFHVQQALRVQLNGRTAGGTPFSIVSDPSWKCEPSGSGYLNNPKSGDLGNNYGGEQIDARKYDPAWCTASFDDSAWASPASLTLPMTLSAQMMEPSRIIEDIPALSVEGNGTYRFTLAKNFSGWVSVALHDQAAGDKITIQVSDNPTRMQAFGQRSLYICWGGATETFQNRFNYAAGRYVTVSGLKNPPALTDVIGHAIGTDLARTGYFSCSNELMNRIYETDLWTFRSDTVEGYTQDCPHRERKGYGEENFATAWGCGLPNYNSGAFYTHAVLNWRDSQRPDGALPPIAPQLGVVYGGPMWSSAPLNMGWETYKTYGDTRLLADSYPAYKSFLDLMAQNVVDGVLKPVSPIFNESKGGSFLGDWARPTDPTDPLKGKEFGTTPEASLFNSCVYAMDLRTFIAVARVLGKNDDAEAYGKRLADFKTTVQAHFFDPGQNLYIDSRQIHLAFPIFADITPDDVKPSVLANFDKEIGTTRPYLDMGSSGLPILLKFLVEDLGDNDVLYDLLSKSTAPGYGFFLSQGETTWPEYWSDHCASHIHTCYTGIASYFMKGIGGIREDPAHYGYQSFIIKPALVGDLTFAEARTESLYGPISSRWEKKDGAVQLAVTIPANSSAIVEVPATDAGNVTEGATAAAQAPGVEFLKMDGAYASFRVQSGVYQFVSR